MPSFRFDPVRHGCCGKCISPCKVPAELEVTIAGLTNANCTRCTDYNATYIAKNCLGLAEFPSAHAWPYNALHSVACQWRYYFSPMPCGLGYEVLQVDLAYLGWLGMSTHLGLLVWIASPYPVGYPVMFLKDYGAAVSSVACDEWDVFDVPLYNIPLFGSCVVTGATCTVTARA